MKRFLALVLILLMLCGCGAKTVPTETEGILPGNIQLLLLDAERSFGGFAADAPGEEAEAVLTMTETVLAEYPAGFLRQLGPVQILLSGELTGEGAFSSGNYAGFTQRTEDGWRIVLDTTACHPGTVHHELCHILDAILTAAGRLSETEWMEMNPPGFRYGSGDWGACSDFFADAYAMTDMKEDRAAVFEAAVMGGAGVFDGKSPLWLKLHTLSQAIRDHFNTDGWPTAAIWELALR